MAMGKVDMMTNDKRIYHIRHKSFDDLKSTLTVFATKQKAMVTTKYHSNHLKSQDFAQIIIASCDIIIQNNSQESNNKPTYYIYDPRVGYYRQSLYYLSELVGYLSQFERIDDIDKTTAQVHKHILVSEPISDDLGRSKTVSGIRAANLAPRHVVKFKNGYYNLKTKLFSTNDYDDNDFIRQLHHNFITYDECDIVYKERVERTFDLWAGGNPDVLKFLLQIVFATIEGYGREKWIVFKSGGGDGKSTYMRILKNIVSSQLTLSMNLHDLSDDETVNHISQSTSLIIGDDLSTRFSMAGSALARFKSLVVGESVKTSAKYLSNLWVSTSAVMIQATNTDVKFYENTDAIADRLVLTNWPSHNFRKNKKLVADVALDDLTGKRGKPNEKFTQTVIAYALYYVKDYFDEFSITDAMLEQVQQELDNSDQVEQFVGFLDDNQVLNMFYLPIKHMFVTYRYWCQHVQNIKNDLTERSFTTRFANALEKRGWERLANRPRLSNVSMLEFNSAYVNNIFQHKILELKPSDQPHMQSMVYVNRQNEITSDYYQLIYDNIMSDTYSDNDILDNMVIQSVIQHERTRTDKLVDSEFLAKCQVIA